MRRSWKRRWRPSWRTLSAPASATRATGGFAAQEISFCTNLHLERSCEIPRLLRKTGSVAGSRERDTFRSPINGGVLASTRSLKRRRHVEDGSLASLKSGPKQINADHQDL